MKKADNNRSTVKKKIVIKATCKNKYALKTKYWDYCNENKTSSKTSNSLKEVTNSDEENLKNEERNMY